MTPAERIWSHHWDQQGMRNSRTMAGEIIDLCL